MSGSNFDVTYPDGVFGDMKKCDTEILEFFVPSGKSLTFRAFVGAQTCPFKMRSVRRHTGLASRRCVFPPRLNELH